MAREEVQEVLDVCASRLEARAVEMDQQAQSEGNVGWETIAAVLRAESAIIRAGCHRYEEGRKANRVTIISFAIAMDGTMFDLTQKDMMNGQFHSVFPLGCWPLIVNAGESVELNVIRKP